MSESARIGPAASVWLVAAAAVGLAGSAGAHDLWIEPSTYRPAPGEGVAVRLRVGRDLLGDAVPADAAGITLFVLRGPRTQRPIELTGAEPAGRTRVDGPGLYVIGYGSLPSPLSEDARAFNEFLRDEGRLDLLEERTQRGATGDRGRQMFSRCAKALVSVEGGPAPRHDWRLGCRLELVAGRDPYAKDAGRQWPVQLLFEGRPLAGVPVTAVSTDGPQSAVKARTDARGQVRFALLGRGPWLVRAVHIVPAARPPAEWETLWASLTFALTPQGHERP